MTMKERIAYKIFKRVDNRPIWIGRNYAVPFVRPRDVSRGNAAKASQKWELGDLYYDIDKHEAITRDLL